jgi:hypothetical protein
LLKRPPWRKLIAVENKFEVATGGRNNMTDLAKTRVSNMAANLAEYAVMLFVALMTGVSTLRLLGILP